MKIQYRSEIDGLRAVAALMVVLCHSGFSALAGGQQGVDVFFVLSGFLITSMLPGMKTGDFLWRRVRRLYPALLALVAVYMVLMPLFGWPISDVWMSVTYTRNLFVYHGCPDTPLKHTWSLGLEAQFYLCWPFVLPLLDRFGRRRLLLGGWLFLTATRATLALLTDADTAFLSQPMHVTGLLLGAACAAGPRLPAWASWAGIALIGAHMVAAGIGGRCTLFGQAAVEVGTALILCAPSSLYRILSIRPLVSLGLVSYGLYLWHAPVSLVMRPYGHAATLVASLPAGIAFGTLSYFTVERLRGRARPRTGSVALSAGSSPADG